MISSAGPLGRRTEWTSQGSSTVATDGRDDAVEGSWSPKRPTTPAQERVARQTDASTTQELASDIEKTREELAQTLDAIADRVSPKKVAERTKAQVRVTVKDGVAKGQVAVKAGAASAAESAKGAVEAAKEMVSGGGSVPATAAPPPAVAPSPGALADASLAPVAAPYGAEVPTYYAPAPSPSRAPLVGGVGAALLVLLLVLRRRRRRR
jgi:hypothetical protein